MLFLGYINDKKKNFASLQTELPNFWLHNICVINVEKSCKGSYLSLNNELCIMAVYYETNQVICNQFDIVCNEKVYFANIFVGLKATRSRNVYT